MTNLLQLAQSGLTYSNLVVQLLTGEAGDCARRLELPEPVPVQVTELQDSVILGKEIHPTARICTANFQYEFVDGRLFRIENKKPFTGKTIETAGKPNLSRELPLDQGLAEYKAFRLLSKLGINTALLNEDYYAQADSSLILRDLSPTNRTPINVLYLDRRNPSSREAIHFKFQVTTGDLLELTFARDFMGKALQIPTLADFTPPELFVGISTVETTADPAADTVASTFEQAWTDLKNKAGTNDPKCIIVFENLNRPDVIQSHLKDRAGAIPTIQLSAPWRSNLPFNERILQSAPHQERGIALIAMGGAMALQVEPVALESDGGVPKPPSLAKAPGDQAVLLLGNTDSPRAFIVEKAIRQVLHETWPENASACFPSLQNELAFLAVNHLAYSNSLVAISLSGKLPLAPLFGQKSQLPEVSRNWTLPMRQMFQQFRGNPLEQVFNLWGADTVRKLQKAGQLEVFRLSEGWLDERARTGVAQVAGYKYTIVQTITNHAMIDDFVATLLDARNQSSLVKACGFKPGMAFRVALGDETLTILACFTCDDLLVEHVNGEGKLLRKFQLDFSGNRNAWVHLAGQIFTEDAAIQSLTGHHP